MSKFIMPRWVSCWKLPRSIRILAYGHWPRWCSTPWGPRLWSESPSTPNCSQPFWTVTSMMYSTSLSWQRTVSKSIAHQCLETLYPPSLCHHHHQQCSYVYCTNMDSVMYVQHPNNPPLHPPECSYPGCFEDKLNTVDFVLDFCLVHPKNFGYPTHWDMTVCKVLGFSFIVDISAQLTYNILCQSTLSELQHPLA